MKRWLLLVLLVLATGSSAHAQTRVLSRNPAYQDIIPAWRIDTLIAEEGGLATLIDSSLYQADDYWNNVTLKVIDVSSNLTDSTRTVTDWTLSSRTLTFSTFATDSIAAGDTFTLFYVLDDPKYKPKAFVYDSSGTDTTIAFAITPGASISTEMLIEVGDNQDSADTKIVLQIAVAPEMPNGQVAWIRQDSITYTTQDTVIYKAWGALQANAVRFILDPVDAPFSASHTATFYGRVMSDK